jgi:hypothetical protein
MAGDPTVADLYALYHGTCGHVGGVGGVGNSRRQLQAQKDLHEQHGLFGWRIRAATVDDITAVVLDLKCDTCDVLPGMTFDPATGTFAPDGHG